MGASLRRAKEVRGYHFGREEGLELRRNLVVKREMGEAETADVQAGGTVDREWLTLQIR